MESSLASTQLEEIWFSKFRMQCVQAAMEIPERVIGARQDYYALMSV